MKNLGNNFMILVVFAGVGVYVIGQVFGTPAAVAAILFASHALCLVAGYGMGIGGAKAGMDALNEHDRVHSRSDHLDKRMDADMFRTVMRLGTQIGMAHAKAHKATLNARYQVVDQQPSDQQEEIVNPYTVPSNNRYTEDEW